MHASQFQKIDTYDWFCGAGSHINKRSASYIYMIGYSVYVKLNEKAHTSHSKSHARYNPSDKNLFHSFKA